MKITRPEALPGWQGAFISGAAWPARGEVPEWLKGTDCKSVGFAYAGSNPALSTNLILKENFGFCRRNTTDFMSHQLQTCCTYFQ